MSLEQDVMRDLKEAMRNKDQAALRGLRAIKAAILLAKTEKGSNEIDENAETKLLQKLVKQRRDSLDIYKKQGRDDLAESEAEEIAVIEKYLPEQLSEADVRAIVAEIITQTGASSPKDMGKVMGLAIAKLGTSTDGKTISKLAREILS